MQTQDLSYKLNNQKITVLNARDMLPYDVSVEVFSLENVYTVAENTYARRGGEYFSDCLVWGNTERRAGSVTLNVDDTADGKVFKARAELDCLVRGVKIRFDNLPLGELISLTDEDKKITEYGLQLKYPEGWRSMSTPLLGFKLDSGKFLYLRCLDDTVNEKRFFIKAVNGKMRVDIVQDQSGTKISGVYEVPAVECGITSDADEIYQRHSDFIKQTYKLEEYADSRIVPEWFKDISLVVTMHMQAFTGHIFHTYESAYKDIERLTRLIEGKHILVYLTGWEGRYYYKYGDYTPDARLGGAEKLKECVKKMQAAGCKVMAMYGMNMANKNLPQIARLAEISEFQSVSGAKFHNGSVDWEGAHHYDFNDLVQLNIAEKTWQDCLFGQIKSATEEYGFDGAFLDIAACHVNDKNNKLYEGVVEFCDRLRTIKPQFLVSGEGYYDGLSRAMPLFQSGHTDGKLHYHDRASEKLFTRFSREFAHLCIGDLSRGSTGVHELGTNTDTTAPLRRGIIPTIALVEDTLDKAFDKVEKAVELSRVYQSEYLYAEKVD